MSEEGQPAYDPTGMGIHTEITLTEGRYFVGPLETIYVVLDVDAGYHRQFSMQKLTGQDFGFRVSLTRNVVQGESVAYEERAVHYGSLGEMPSTFNVQADDITSEPFPMSWKVRPGRYVLNIQNISGGDAFVYFKPL